MKKSIVAITQARFSSTRLPGKVFKPLGDQTVLDLHLKRIKQSKLITEFVLATTEEPESIEIKAIAARNGFQCYHGSLNDVLDRFYQAAKIIQPDYIVRLTSDCPLIDSFYIDDLIQNFLEKNVDYASNSLNPTLPDGLDAEIFTYAALEVAWKEAKKESEREHVTPYIRDCGKFKIHSVEYVFKWDKYRLTLDTNEDYELLKKLVAELGENATTEEYVQCLIKNPGWLEINSQFERNEGYKKSIKGDSLC
jgi:spore coat polysaccharide biosynthesis protein SpsF (cytidylyltransferase family)